MKSKIFLSSFAIAALLISCSSEMDYHEYDTFGEDYIKLNFTNVDGLVSNIYSQLDYDWGDDYGGGMLASACDEAVFSNTSASIHDFYNGSWSASNAKGSMWTDMYAAIADCNHYLAHFLGLTFPELKDNVDYLEKMYQYKRSPFEVKALRAYFYFNLVRQYGDVPYYTSDISADQRNALSRTPAQAVLDSVIATCDAVVDSLPISYSDMGEYTNNETGRINRIAVLSLKARTALYAASPLFNTSNNKELWHRAALASKAVLDACAANAISLGTYASTWGETNYMSGSRYDQELIWARRVGTVSTLETRNYPVGITSSGNGGNCPSETLAEAYQTVNGYDVTLTANGYTSDDPKFNPSKPFANRDPRFALTFACNGDTKWPTVNTTALQIYQGGTSGEPTVNATPTGYYLKKLLDGSIDLSSTSKKKTSKHSWIVFRLGEFYLNYAEAVYNYLGSADAVSAEFPMSALAAVNTLRARTGVKMPAITATNFWAKYERERMVELSFEGHRFWDLRRWKEASAKLTSVKELKITMNTDGTLSYAPAYETRQWDDKMYLFPIPQSEILKSQKYAGGVLKQNTGW